jgi:hypothetical protein
MFHEYLLRHPTSKEIEKICGKKARSSPTVGLLVSFERKPSSREIKTKAEISRASQEEQALKYRKFKS